MNKFREYKMGIVPFMAVPENVLFRYKKDWWRRKAGTKYQAEKFVDDSLFLEENNTHIKDDEYVVMAINLLSNKADRLFLIEEFNLCLKDLK